ncbi:acyl-CoA dehydrogenase family protein [Leifsonia poae]|uniref:Acyl-CoA dehydrogenase n=1 Tax=Leifsonia poae TaxID=110933 RepID=A0A9W6H7B7_9MICO|nr:acyl-CoA dehydrogenase family protein [Leifsonia poae]GLJ74891.1 acyl-CoA dehydrogenase [Leifsonia poae]
MTQPFSNEQRAYLAAAEQCGGRVAPLLDALRVLDPAALGPQPASGGTAERFRFLAAVAEADVTAARVIEPHLDAIAILRESGADAPPAGRTWGVFAAEAPGAGLLATERRDAGGWQLDGVKPWCSLGAQVTDALITARTDAAERRMFSVDLRQQGVHAEPVEWVARGLAEVESGPLEFGGAVAEPVGEAGWYLTRPGFRWGAIGVAACWWGGCLPLYAALRARAGRDGAGPLAAAAAGRLHRALEGARLQLAHAGDVIDAGGLDPHAAAVLAHTVRGQVADTVVEVLGAVRDVLGPAALAFDESIARRYADLDLYVSQYHRGPDDVSLFEHLRGEAGPAW